MDMIPSEVVAISELGIGDLVFEEPGYRGLLAAGVQKIHLFARPDGMKLYHNYPGVVTYPLGANVAMRRLMGQFPHIVLDNTTHPHYNHTNRVSLFTQSIMTTIGLPAPDYQAPALTVADEHVEWAETYANLLPGEKLILWQMNASKPYKTLPAEKSLTAISRLAGEGYRILATCDNHNLLPRIPRVKWMRGVSIERFMGLCHLAHRVVAHDSAPAWIGAATGAGVVAVFGPTDPQQYAIRGDNVKALRWMPEDRCLQCTFGCNDAQCLSDIPDDVLYDAASEGTLPPVREPSQTSWGEYTTCAMLLLAQGTTESLGDIIESLLRQTHQYFELVIGDVSESGQYDNLLSAHLDADDRVKVIRMPAGTHVNVAQETLAEYASCANLLYAFAVEPGQSWEPEELSKRLYNTLITH